MMSGSLVSANTTSNKAMSGVNEDLMVHQNQTAQFNALSGTLLVGEASKDALTANEQH